MSAPPPRPDPVASRGPCATPVVGGEGALRSKRWGRRGGSAEEERWRRREGREHCLPPVILTFLCIQRRFSGLAWAEWASFFSEAGNIVCPPQLIY